MVAGRLQEKKDKFYIVLDYKDSEGKRKSKWIATGLPVKGNKKKAEQLLFDARREFTPPKKRTAIQMTYYFPISCLDGWR